MYRKFLFMAGFVLASTAQAQMPDRTLMRHIAVDYAFAGTPSGTTTGWVEPTPVLPVNGEGALLGQVDNRTRPAELAGFTDAPIDGSRALLGNWPSALPVDAGGAERQSSFSAEVRGDVISNAWGEAEFGTIHAVDQSSATFVVSLGVCGEQSAVLFTRRSGAPLALGRYRVSERANGADEILALVLTGSPTRPTGVFQGKSGWLVVTAASDRLTAGQFQIDAIGFTAAEPGQENRHVNVTGSFSATTGSTSFRVCENAE
jgi:hypothetical protein